MQHLTQEAADKLLAPLKEAGVVVRAEAILGDFPMLVVRVPNSLSSEDRDKIHTALGDTGWRIEIATLRSPQS